MKVKNILEREAEKLATKAAEKRELEVSSWIGHHKGIKKLLFGRWLLIFCDMKGFNFSGGHQK